MSAAGKKTRLNRKKSEQPSLSESGRPRGIARDADGYAWARRRGLPLICLGVPDEALSRCS